MRVIFVALEHVSCASATYPVTPSRAACGSDQPRGTSIRVCPCSGPVSAVKVSLNVFVLPAETWSGVMSTRPTPGAADGLWAGTSSKTSPSTVMRTRGSFRITTGPLRVREAEVKQPPRVAVRIGGVQHDRDQSRLPSPRRGDQAVAGDCRPAGLDAVGAPVAADQQVLVHVRLRIGRLRPLHVRDVRARDLAEGGHR